MGLSEVIGAVGATAGLAALGLGNASALARMTSLPSWAVAVAGVLVLLLPETKRRELEAISDENAEPPRPCS
jgi:hypothetical protein